MKEKVLIGRYYDRAIGWLGTINVDKSSETIFLESASAIVGKDTEHQPADWQLIGYNQIRLGNQNID